MTDKLHPVFIPVKTSHFLDRFSLEHRSAIANRFFKAAREGATTIETVIQKVKADSISRLLFADRDVWNEERSLLSMLEGEEVRVYVKEILERESLPAEERQKLKAARGEQYRREYMKVQKPTEPQLRYLKSLGCRTIPVTRFQASELIEEHKR